MKLLIIKRNLIKYKWKYIPLFVTLILYILLIDIYSLIVSYTKIEAGTMNTPYIFELLLSSALGIYVLNSVLDMKMSWEHPIIHQLRILGFTLKDIQFLLEKEIIIIEGIFFAFFGFFGVFGERYLLKYVFLNFTMPNQERLLFYSFAVALIIFIITLLEQTVKQYLLTQYYYKLQTTTIAYKEIFKRQKIRALMLLFMGMIIMNTIITLNKSININKLVNKSICTDFIISKNKFDDGAKVTSKLTLTTKEVENLQGYKSIKEGGPVFYNIKNNIQLLSRLPAKSPYLNIPYGENSKGSYNVNIYGGNKFVLKQMKLIAGKINYKKLESGKYIIYGVEYNRNSVMRSKDLCKKWTYYHPGNRIKLNINGINKTFIIMATVKTNHTIVEEQGPYYKNSELTFFLPVNIYTKWKCGIFRRYICNTTGSTKELTHYLNIHNYYFLTKGSIRKKYTNEIKHNTNIAINCNLIIGGLGLLNLFNLLIVKTKRRKYEFYILRALGMTSKNIEALLFREQFYTVIKFMILTIICNFLSYIILRNIVQMFAETVFTIDLIPTIFWVIFI